MNVKTYRAKTMQEALALVRDELGSKASVLRTREVPARGLSRLWGSSGLVEVVASDNVSVPSRLPTRQPVVEPLCIPSAHAGIDLAAAADERRLLPGVAITSSNKVDRLATQLLQLARDLVAAEVPQSLVHELVERAGRDAKSHELHDLAGMKRHLADLLAAEITVVAPIRVTRGRQRLVALVGPTGVGKTTTLAKLAAHFRLRENHRVGLVTVDTYRMAAVEQLRSYAEIIDLPLEVVNSPGAMQQAASRMPDVDLVLMDTAGCSPRDTVKIHDLKLLLAAAGADEIHLVLSSVASVASLACSIDGFAPTGVTALLLTKLDEASSLGSLLPILHRGRLPLSYTTHGQAVPDDIAAIDGQALACAILGLPVLSVR
jgi:flagellar biosynthesis protein FlhF